MCVCVRAVRITSTYSRRSRLLIHALHAKCDVLRTYIIMYYCFINIIIVWRVASAQFAVGKMNVMQSVGFAFTYYYIVSFMHSIGKSSGKHLNEPLDTTDCLACVSSFYNAFIIATIGLSCRNAARTFSEIYTNVLVAP